MLKARGQFVIGSKNVKVPIWSPTKEKFVYMELSKGRPVSLLAKDKGNLPVDLAAPYLLVDFEGGKISKDVNRNRHVSDEAGIEALLLGEDGKLRVHTSWNDVADQERARREQGWVAWQKETKDANATDKSGDKDPFGKGPGGGSPGGGAP